MSQSLSRVTKPAVRACTNCVRAKARCAPGPSSTCERCQRMGKSCQPSPPVRKRRTVAKASTKEVQKLEEKLDGLVSILREATQGQTGLNRTALDTALERGGPASYAESVSAATPAQDAAGPARTPDASGDSPGLGFSLEPGDNDASLYLDRFRSSFIGNLPFLVISPSLTARQLCQESPLLWIAIMTVASIRTTQQRAMSKRIREIFGREAYIEGTRNMDFLLAVLVYATWDRYYSLDKPIFTSLVQLAISILYDLGLDKPPLQDAGLMLAYDLKGISRPSHFSRSPSMEERRALLGCFLVSSGSMLSRNGEPLRWTPYFDDCLRVVEEQKEETSDILLVQLVKLRLLAGKAMDYPGTSSATGSVSPASFYLQSMQMQLRDVRSQIPSEITDNKILQLELLITELLIHEIGFSSAPDIFPRHSNQRFDCLCVCLQTTKTWVDTMSSVQPAEYVGLSSLMCSNMTRSFIDLYRLSACDYPEWDRGLVQETVNVSWVLEEAARCFSRVKDEAGFDPEGSEEVNYFTIMADKMEALKVCWDAAMVPMTDSWPHSEVDLGNFSNEFLSMWNW
ncbi:hypothetical protein BO71DRAFT_3062 [Aspergillus ellipticus CBS 707.79]|uniref:Zn(2)-C6 fungal-type domain-containing protein n=1 Tax=Aspergillus ellipticus CBS 707.79 TaxID=1448320 RepID=A0A319DNK1_9EURO|nr:hypothetical protein BO71DRAFT_3062 [Aspergillus ellipticus CBS 707.79]